MPSVGLEFITQMGVHIPDYVDAGIQTHTNMYHESSLNAKATVNRRQVKLSIPAPQSNTQLFSVRSVTHSLSLFELCCSHSPHSTFFLKCSTKVLSLSSGQTTMGPCKAGDRADSVDCQPLLSGLKLCTAVRYSNPTSVDQAPCSPLTGETR